MGTESSMDSVMGNVALLVSSASSVVVKTLVMAPARLSFEIGTLERVRRPISDDAVDDMIRRSCKFGAKSFKRRIEC